MRCEVVKASCDSLFEIIDLATEVVLKSLLAPFFGVSRGRGATSTTRRSGWRSATTRRPTLGGSNGGGGGVGGGVGGNRGAGSPDMALTRKLNAKMSQRAECMIHLLRSWLRV